MTITSFASRTPLLVRVLVPVASLIGAFMMGGAYDHDPEWVSATNGFPAWGFEVVTAYPRAEVIALSRARAVMTLKEIVDSVGRVNLEDQTNGLARAVGFFTINEESSTPRNRSTRIA